MAPMEPVQAFELQGDLVKAFAAIDFQAKLLELKQKQFSAREEFVAAMRNAAMVAQKQVLRKHGFPETFAGVAEMMTALASHFMMWESLSQQEATTKAKALIVGLPPSKFAGWSWPEIVVSPKFSNEKPSYPKTATLTADQAVELQEDLVNAFSGKDFQSKLQALSQEQHADREQFAAAMRDTAMVAQKVVLRKHNFPESFAGVKEMTTVLASHFVVVEALSQQVATAKAKGLIVGMGSSKLAGWSWPEFVVAPESKAKKLSDQDDDDDDADTASTCAPMSFVTQVSGGSIYEDESM